MPNFKIFLKHGVIICWAKVIGKGKPILLRLALDTGATITTIPPEAAFSIGLNPASGHKTIEVTMGSAVVLCPVVTIPKFSCLGHEVKGLDVICHSLPSESNVDGLIGLNFLKNFKVTLNFPKNIIEITK